MRQQRGREGEGGIVRKMDTKIIGQGHEWDHSQSDRKVCLRIVAAEGTHPHPHNRSNSGVREEGYEPDTPRRRSVSIEGACSLGSFTRHLQVGATGQEGEGWKEKDNYQQEWSNHLRVIIV